MELGRRFLLIVFGLLFALGVYPEYEFWNFETIHFEDIFRVLETTRSISSYVDDAREKYHNNDIVGRLYIESIDIDVPVVQSSDNEFYLSRDEYKNKNNVGSIFLDYRNNVDLDRKLLIFGHNSRDLQTEFKKMENFLSSSFFNNSNNRNLILETKNKISEYYIDSIIIVSDDFQHMNLSFTQEEWKKHIEWINNNSLYDGANFSLDDDILIMQTCYYEPDDSYLLVVAKKIREEFY